VQTLSVRQTALSSGLALAHSVICCGKLPLLLLLLLLLLLQCVPSRCA
jgi:hypothetical protein